MMAATPSRSKGRGRSSAVRAAQCGTDPREQRPPKERIMNTLRLNVGSVLACAATMLLSGCPGDDSVDRQNLRPAFLGTVTKTTYDGVTDDLLTAGLGAVGLG